MTRGAGREIEPMTLARRAHGVEVVRLGQQSGVQDQIAAAYGGIGYVEIAPYPLWTRTPVEVSCSTREALSERLALIYLGAAHASSDVHESVIRSLQDGPGEATGAAKAALQRLRDAARAGRDALSAGDLDAYGRALIANTEAQALLHPALVSEAAREAFSLAAQHGAAGWKVNGAGGDGGSVTVLAPARVSDRQAFMHAVATQLRGATAIPLTLAEGGVATSAVEL